MISKEHARIEKDESGYKIVNKGANGIYVNAKKIHTEQHLKIWRLYKHYGFAYCLYG